MRNSPPIPYTVPKPKEQSDGWIKRRIRAWLGLDKLEARILDIERHFVTQRNPMTGAITETLADVPVEQRKPIVPKLRGMSIEQRRRWMEETDGGRNIN